MPSPDWALIAEHLNDCLAKSRLSSQDLARKAGVDRKTVDRLRAGHSVRTQTLQWIEQALGVQLGQRSDSRTATSDPEYGGYQRSVVEPYVGEYTGYRRSFDKPRQLIASYLAIHWDSGVNALRFTETQHNQADGGREYAYEFAGDVLIPPNLGVMHLVVRSGDGRIRMNIPAQTGCWTWRFHWDMVGAEPAKRLAHLTGLYGRSPSDLPASR